MNYQVLSTEYPELAGVPFHTPAWSPSNLDDLESSPQVVGQDLTVPFRQGVRPQRRLYGPKPMSLSLDVFGHVDPEGTALEGGLSGLRRNVDHLKELWRPRQNNGDGTVLFRHVLAQSVRQGPCLIVAPLQFQLDPPNLARCTIELLLPAGVLVNPDETVDTLGPYAVETDIVVQNPGTADQFDVRLELTGTASEVQLTNLTWDPSGQTWLSFTGALQSGVYIDTDAFTVERDEGGPELSPVGGLREHSGHERWLPLAPGDNTVRVTPTGGDVTVVYRHNAPYA